MPWHMRTRAHVTALAHVLQHTLGVHTSSPRTGALYTGLFIRDAMFDATFWRKGGSRSGDGVHLTCPTDAASPRNGLERTLGRRALADASHTSKGSTSST